MKDLEDMNLSAMQYRDEQRNEFTQVTAQCKCGRGGWLRLPKHPDLDSYIPKQELSRLVEGMSEIIENVCVSSERVDGKLHSWKFDGDDPNVICCYCGEVRRTGMIVIPGKEDSVKIYQRTQLAELKKELDL